MKQASIEQEKNNRLYQDVRFEKSSSRTKTFVRRKVFKSKARVTRTPRKAHLGKNANPGVVKEKETACQTVEKLPRMTKRGSSRDAASGKTNSQF